MIFIVSRTVDNNNFIFYLLIYKRQFSTRSALNCLLPILFLLSDDDLGAAVDKLIDDRREGALET